MKIIIAGSRNFNNYELLVKKCKAILKNVNTIEIVHGCAKGADLLGERFAKENNLIYHGFPANWYDLNITPCKIKKDKNGKEYNALAGHNRNKKMALFSDALIAFWDGKSTGTKNMIEEAKKLDLQVRIVKY